MKFIEGKDVEVKTIMKIIEAAEMLQTSLRGDCLPKYGCFFWKISEGGGVISDPKNYIADFFVFFWS